MWIPAASKEPLSSDVLEEWMKKGPKKLTIHDETKFVDPQILEGVLNAKVSRKIFYVFTRRGGVAQNKEGYVFQRYVYLPTF